MLRCDISYIGKFELAITDASKKVYRILLKVEQSFLRDALFLNDLFNEFCESLLVRNEAIVVRDISLLICPSA
jgi:hypothetical protein